MLEFIPRYQSKKLFKELNWLSYYSKINTESDYGVKRIAEHGNLDKADERKLKRSSVRDFLISNSFSLKENTLTVFKSNFK